MRDNNREYVGECTVNGPSDREQDHPAWHEPPVGKQERDEEESDGREEIPGQYEDLPG